MRDHPSHKLVEVYIDDPAAGSAMEKEFNIPASCWAHANDNPRSNGGQAVGALGGADVHAKPRKLCAGETPEVIVLRGSI